MVRPTTPQPPANIYVTSKQIIAGIGDSLTNLFSICTRKAKKQLSRATRKFQSERVIISASALSRSKIILASINKKSIQFRMKMKKRSRNGSDSDELDHEVGIDGGLWRRTILMGDKCQPLDFPGVIYYDCNGNVMSELPVRSPKVSSLSNYAFVDDE
ncbi:uncharacterized protein LOC124933475 [Impatiens glandulifera]|uniref:uncharacterized protein LOC124933475 n=1 Tax=Impatiens glandulifera TaxID=253017 RepID=UPI001FB188E0|nr:uncharacterized protein LOC124933475 [Impatiens glandulifera]